MARKASRSRADQPQSNTVLIVFLVFSILLNLALGVMFYLAQEKITQAETKEAAAIAPQRKMEEQRNAATDTWIPWLRGIIGETGLSTEEQNKMKENLARDTATLPQAWYEGKVWKELFGRNQNDPGLIGPFTAASGKPSISLMDKIRQLNDTLGKTV